MEGHIVDFLIMCGFGGDCVTGMGEGGRKEKENTKNEETKIINKLHKTTHKL